MLINRVAYSGLAVVAVDSVPASEEGGLYVADYEGFFTQQGLTVKIKPSTGGEAGIPDLQARRADVVAGNYVSFILAQLAGKFDGKPASMRIIAAGSELQPGVIPAGGFPALLKMLPAGRSTRSGCRSRSHDRRAGARRGTAGRLRPGADAELPLHRLHRDRADAPARPDAGREER
jgi:hypothetical protein